MKEFKGKTAVITGAANGFGKVFAAECAARGMKLVLSDIDTPALEAVVQAMKAKGAEVLGVPGDTSLYEDVQALVKAATDTFGTLDLMFNNAGVYYIGTLWDMPARDFQWMMEVNTLGVMYGVKEAVPVMRKQGTPCHIVNVSSIAGIISTRSMATYHASKHAVVAASEAVLYDLQSLEDNNIGLTVFCPGFVQTDLNNCERHRPERFKAPDDPYYASTTYKKNVTLVDRFITTGEPIDVVVPQVFGAIENNQFYLRTDATDQTYLPWMEKRFDNIKTKTNPNFRNMG